MYCLVMSLDPATPPSTQQSIQSINVVVATRLAVPEQIDPSEVVIQKPMRYTGTQAIDILSCNHNYYIMFFKPGACQLKVGAPGF